MTRRAISILSCAVWLVAQPGHACVLIPYSIQRYCERADAVFVGTVTGTERDDLDRLLVARVQVEQTLRGTPGESAALIVPPDTYGSTCDTQFANALESGERYLLIVQAAAENEYLVPFDAPGRLRLSPQPDPAEAILLQYVDHVVRTGQPPITVAAELVMSPRLNLRLSIDVAIGSGAALGPAANSHALQQPVVVLSTEDRDAGGLLQLPWPEEPIPLAYGATTTVDCDLSRYVDLKAGRRYVLGVSVGIPVTETRGFLDVWHTSQPLLEFVAPMETAVRPGGWGNVKAGSPSGHAARGSSAATVHPSSPGVPR